VEDLSEVQVDPEANGDEIGEQEDEPKPVNRSGVVNPDPYWETV
jgi:hypothetical protein